MSPKFYKKILKNGMTVLFEKRDLPIVSVGFAVRNGGVNESAEEKGISHYIEHMLYKGTPTRNNAQIAEDIEKNGGRLNGFTSEAITAFWCKMPSRHLDVALDVLSDIIKNPLFDEKELEKERKVIFEEIKMYHDNPSDYVLEQINGSLYESPFGSPLIGTEKTMNSITRKKILAKFKQVYQPNNIILSVVGDTNFDFLINFAEKAFGNGRGRVPKFKIKKRNQTRVEKRKGVDQANLVFAYHAPLFGDKRAYAAKVLSTLMVGGMSSRLFKEIREKRNMAYVVKGALDISKEYSHDIIYIGTTPEKVEEVKKLILKEFEDVSNNLDEKELNQVKEQLIGNYHISLEDSQSQMINLITSEIEQGDAKEFYEFEKNIKKVKLEDVKELAKIKNYSFFALVPE